MVRYKILVSCGTAVTATYVKSRVIKELKKRGITNIDFKICRVSEAINVAKSYKADAIVFSGHPPGKFPVPAFSGIPFISGIGLDEIADKLVAALKKVK